MKISILKVPASETITINTLALQKKQAGEKVYNLSAGEPMIDTDSRIINATVKALKNNKTHYPPVAGISELRETVSKWMNKNYGAKFSTKETLVINGGKLGLFLLAQALLKKNDEVLIVSPYWVSYSTIVKIFGSSVKVIKTTPKSGWKISPKDIAESSSKKTKILILNNGNNPTGSLYSKNELEKILAIAKKKNIFVISDEVYSGLVYGKKFISCASFKKYKDNVAIIQSCSKSFAMTGFRVGFVLAEEKIIKTLSGLTSQSTSGVPLFCQYGALEAFKNSASITGKINKEMKNRRDVFIKEFNKVFLQKITLPDSALYVFAPLSAMGWKGENSTEFCELAMKEANVAVVPGSAFGQESYVRFSFGENPKILKEGINALAKWIENRK